MITTIIPIKDICVGIYDGPHATPPAANSGGVFLGISNITKNGHLDLSNIKYISEEYLPKWTKRVTPQEGDIVFSYEATLNLYAIIPKNFYGCLGRRMALIRTDNNKVNNKFLFYYFFSKKWRDVVAEHTITGSTVDRIPITTFPGFPIELPSLETQHRIAYTLSRYDSLIDNYQKQIKLLEEAAQRLYKEWFVKLRFPGHENTKIVDGVPEGWEKKSVGDMLRRMERTKQIPSNEYLKRGEIPVIDQSRNFVAGYTNDEDSRLKVTTPVILFGDHTRVLKYLSFSFARGADGTQLIMSNDIDRLPQSLFYNALVEKDLSNYSYARHFKYLKAEQILVPTKEIAQKFDTFAAKIYEQIQSCRHQLRLLTESRDRLLPKLLSGEIEV
ncbi:restriction endonuclease subunit S [Prevotella sp.]|uniref:restriction endonuclease subunit S n=1 Tax=Prevotella sp. TaxID=59823 RepID=UPI0025EC2C67|nr:restriction endonuclease subunit S [Prevotella sp.]